MFEAIQYGEREDVKARLFRQVDGAVDHAHLLELLRRRALTNDTMPEAKVAELRLEMERAEALRLQPHHIQSFFVEAFQHLGGRLKRREEGRSGKLPMCRCGSVNAIVRSKSARRSKNNMSGSASRRAGSANSRLPHSSIRATLCRLVISLIREQYEQIMRQGAILVDDTNSGDALSAIFLLEHSVQDGRVTSAGKPHVISQRLQFAAINKAGRITNAGIAPHLNLRPATVAEIEAARDLLDESWLTTELEKAAIRFATVELAQAHVAEVKARRLPEIEKVEQEVRARLKKGINCSGARARSS